MRDDERFRPDLIGKARGDFEKTARGNIYQNREAARNAPSVDGIERRTAQVREKLRAHLNRNRDLWTAKEVKRLMKQSPLSLKHGLSGGPKPPFGAEPVSRAHQRAIQEKAYANVNRRCNIRLHSLDKMEQRMIRNLTRTRSRSR